MDEGYIKFHADWEKSPPLPIRFFKKLNKWRSKLYDLKLMGSYANGIGYGNVSERFDRKGSFIITGSGTGVFGELKPEHYCLVTKVNITANEVTCIGPIIASSESMSHATIYKECPEINAVIHVHYAQLWKKLIHQVPTTGKSISYGTPEMAKTILELLLNSDLKKQKIIIMEGHEEGVFTFGKNLDEAGEILLHYYDQFSKNQKVH